MKGVVLLSVLLLVARSQGRYEDKKRRLDHTRPTAASERALNICDLQQEHDLNMFCVCEPRNEHNNATSANCWMFNSGESEDSPVWTWFRSQRHLTKMILNVRSLTQLSYVPTRALKQLSKLKTFEIVYANIETIEPFAFANLTLLQDLGLTRNRIMTLKKFSIAFLPDLKVITLGENRISELNREVFVSLPSLRKLYIDRNNLSLIHEGAFSALYSLEELELHGNQLTVVTKETFRGLSRLRRLDLSLNALTYIAEGTFKEMPALEELLLERNKIEALDPGALIDLEFLGKVYLTANSLRTLPPGLFEDTTSLRFLNVRDNILHTLNHQVFAPIILNLFNQSAYLLVDGNPLVCDCRLDWLHNLYNSSNSESVRTTIEEMTCIQTLNDLDSEPLRARMPDNTIGDTPTQESMEPFSEKNFMAIPRESLPCPQDLRATGVPAVQLATKTESSGLKTSQSLVLIIFSICLLFP
uniref:Connectin n=2 Tax=Lygus hesperus TaxID=30085 RepID=A0A0A9X110_LYGHE